MNDALTAGRGERAAGTSIRPRLGFAGAGWIGRNRLGALAESGLGEIVAIADPAAESATAAQALVPAAAIVPDLDALLDLELDGLVIATPNALHAAQAVAALERGVSVFCQKPLGRNGAETALVLDAARAADRLLRVDLSYRFTTGMQRIRRLAADGELGDIYAVEMVFHNAYGPDKPWFYDQRLAGGGCLLDLGIHLVDLALWTLDFPTVTRVEGQTLNSKQLRGSARHGVEDYSTAQIRLGTGASVQLSCSWKVPAGYDARIEAAFFGTRGGARFYNVGGSFYDFAAEYYSADRVRRSLAEPPEAWGGRAAVDWLGRLVISPRFDPEISSLQQVADTLDLIYAAPR